MSKGVLVKIKPVLAIPIIDTIGNSDQRHTAKPLFRKSQIQQLRTLARVCTELTHAFFPRLFYARR